MFEIDKRKFGAFVCELRKEKGYTQKELAEKLFISDKAISKWETAVSIPDTALLVPLADLLGVTVTELLMCERLETARPMAAEDVESVVQAAIAYSEGKAARAYQIKNRWSVAYVFSLVIGTAGTLLNVFCQLSGELLITVIVLGAVFGAYFCFFVKMKLPVFYDENRCGFYCDGVLRMNMPGVAFNNSNWPYIVRAGRIWSCSTVALYPLINLIMNYIGAVLWRQVELYVFLILILGGLFIPIYIVGKKYG